MLVSVFSSVQSVPAVYEICSPAFGMQIGEDYDMYDLFDDIFHYGYSIMVQGSVEDCAKLMECLSEHGNEYESSDGCYGVSFEGLIPDVQMVCFGESGAFVPAI